MADRGFLGERFDEEWTQLRRLAFRVLGTVAEADEALQEEWVGTDRVGGTQVESLEQLLRTVVNRVCRHMTHVRHSPRDVTIAPYAIDSSVAIDGPLTSEEEELMADGFGVALQAVLEDLGPAERIAFFLHDILALPFEEIGPMIGRNEEAVHQLASRARRQVQGAAPAADTELYAQMQVVEGILAAAKEGDFDGLLEMLDPKVTLRINAEPGSTLVGESIIGDKAVLAEAQRWGVLARHVRPAVVNGLAGAFIGRPDGIVFTVIALTVANSRIQAIYVLVDPARLARLSW